MPFATTAARTALLALAGTYGLAAGAQPTQTASPAPPAAPPAWSVTTNAAQGAVTIAATAKNGSVQFVATCRSSDPGISATISRYQGAGLRTDGQVEPVTLFAQGAEWRDAFSVRLRYAAAERAWVLAKPLSPIFLSSFSRGATLFVVNGGGQELFAFDLTGSTAAVRAMRTTCGLP